MKKKAEKSQEKKDITSNKQNMQTKGQKNEKKKIESQEAK